MLIMPPPSRIIVLIVLLTMFCAFSALATKKGNPVTPNAPTPPVKHIKTTSPSSTLGRSDNAGGSYNPQGSSTSTSTGFAPRSGRVTDNFNQQAPSPQLIQARQNARILDLQGGGHGRQRHGSHVTAQDHKKRLRTGIAPDGKYAPTNISTSFKKNEYDKTLDHAKLTFKKEDRIDFDKGHQNNLENRYELITDHKRPIGGGFKGDVNSKVEIKNPKTGKINTGYTKFKVVNRLNSTKTIMRFNSITNKWFVVSHMPIK